MPTFTITEAAAATAVGTNLMAGHRLQISPNYRKVKRIGVVGGAALRDSAIQLFYGNTYMGEFYATTIGAVLPLDGRDLIRLDSSTLLKPNEPLNVIISDASATNAMAITLETEDVYPKVKYARSY